MSPRRLWPVALSVVSACDITFSPVDTTPSPRILVNSAHEAALITSLDMVLAADGWTPPEVFLNEMSVEVQAEQGAWRYRSTPLVDSLSPNIVLEVQEASSTSVRLSLASRRGAAIWREDGVLELPVVYDGRAGTLESSLSWRVDLLDSSGRPQASIQSQKGPFPSPFVLDAGLVPDSAVAALVQISFRDRHYILSHLVSIVVISAVTVPIPLGGSSALHPR